MKWQGAVEFAAFLSCFGFMIGGAARAAPTCPLGYGTTDAAKSNKLYLYFPAADDTAYPYMED